MLLRTGKPRRVRRPVLRSREADSKRRTTEFLAEYRNGGEGSSQMDVYECIALAQMDAAGIAGDPLCCSECNGPCEPTQQGGWYCPQCGLML